MLINAERQPADQDAGDLCDPTQYAPRDRRPYWNEDIASFSAAVWLPTGTADRGAAINRPHGWSSKTAAHSWFSTNRIAAPNPDLPGLYSPASTRSVAGCTGSGATERQSRRVRVYPNQQQKARIATWLDASRWTYNLTAEILQSGIPAVWKHIASMVMLEVNEAYSSKTRSWDGAVNTKLGGAKVIRDDTGFGMDRDVNGARGIFLRALGDSPFLRGLLTQVASQTTAVSSNVV